MSVSPKLLVALACLVAPAAAGVTAALEVDPEKLPPPRPALFYALTSSIDPSYMDEWDEGKTVEVQAGFYIESLSAIQPTEMSFDMDLYLRTSWFDRRLRHSQPRHFVIREANVTDEIWTPDLYFANAKSSEFQSVTKSNAMFLVYPNGYVHYSVRVISTMACNMDLHNYPMDVQTCEMRILSYAHTDSEVRIRWFDGDDAITYNKGSDLVNGSFKGIQLPEMTILGTKTAYCDGTYSYGKTKENQLHGSFSCLLAKIYFKREIGYHMVQTYIPTFLIVVISWISFWIDPAAIPARISLSFTTLLTLATMTAGIRTALPPVSYAKAIDYWIGVCVLFVFGALLEFAFVSSFVRRAARIQMKIGGLTEDAILLTQTEAYNQTELLGEESVLLPRFRHLRRAPSGAFVADRLTEPAELIKTMAGLVSAHDQRRRNAAVGGGSHPSAPFDQDEDLANAMRTPLGPRLASLRGDGGNGLPNLSPEKMPFVDDGGASQRGNGGVARAASPDTFTQARRRSTPRVPPVELELEQRISETELELVGLRRRYSRIAKLGDAISRIAFPGLFVLFNVAYWLQFTTFDNNIDHMI